jgi:hypothetical protein
MNKMTASNYVGKRIYGVIKRWNETVPTTPRWVRMCSSCWQTLILNCPKQ